MFNPLFDGTFSTLGGQFAEQIAFFPDLKLQNPRAAEICSSLGLSKRRFIKGTRAEGIRAAKVEGQAPS